MIERLSLGGRLRMAAACPDANAPLLAEAADAIEQHEAFKQEVSDALKIAREALTKARNTMAGCGMPKIAANICDEALAALKETT